jgi:triphosphoribosyl-dephospho-CoA synthase
MNTQSIGMSQGERAKWSIVQEASAIKAGNVHPGASFEEMTYAHFLEVADVLKETIQKSLNQSLGPMVWECTASMLETVRVNTSLGTILLLAPLIQCEKTFGSLFCSRLLKGDWDGQDIRSYLSATTTADCADIYQAIATCNPGGLGTSQRLDVRVTPPESILEAMAFAADRDDIALQYTNGYLEVARYARRMLDWAAEGTARLDAIRWLQLNILAERVDSHIVRKCGLSVGEYVRKRAQQVLDSAEYGTQDFEHHWQAFDLELRNGPKRMNPGTTADMIAAALYVTSSQCTD